MRRYAILLSLTSFSKVEASEVQNQPVWRKKWGHVPAVHKRIRRGKILLFRPQQLSWRTVDEVWKDILKGSKGNSGVEECLLLELLLNIGRLTRRVLDWTLLLL